MILLIHKESGDVDIVKKCELKDNMLVVDFGFDWIIEQPVEEYECKTVKEIK
jgi:hypothetical protein